MKGWVNLWESCGKQSRVRADLLFVPECYLYHKPPSYMATSIPSLSLQVQPPVSVTRLIQLLEHLHCFCILAVSLALSVVSCCISGHLLYLWSLALSFITRCIIVHLLYLYLISVSLVCCLSLFSCYISCKLLYVSLVCFPGQFCISGKLLDI